MDLLQKFIQNLKKYPTVQPADRHLLAVSGGVDSVVLCHLMLKSGYDFAIAHCNFNLRAAESDRDEFFVKVLAERCGKPLFVKRFNTQFYATQNKLSIQVAARELRYRWFRELIDNRENGLHYLMTAHHANDSLETLVMNFFKGTGISGLHGILPMQAGVFRPLLFAKKEELLAYATQHKLSFVEDSSNLTDKYTRNFLRLQLFPLIKEVYPAVEDNLLDNIERFSEAECLYNETVENYKKKLMEQKGNEIHIPVLKLEKVPALNTILYEIIKHYGFSPQQVKDVAGLLKSETGKYVSSAGHRIFKNRKWLIICPTAATLAQHIIIENGDNDIIFEGGKLSMATLENNDHDLSTLASVAMIDLDKITFPIVLRKRRQGDYFYPLGMRKKKKLSRFLIDLKLSAPEKENVWVVEHDQRIIWVVGYRLDDRFKIERATRNILKLTIS